MSVGQRTHMSKKITFTLLWILAFSAAAFIASMVMFAVFGMSGVSEESSWLGYFGVVWSWTLLSVPLLTLLFCIRGVLPGTRRTS
jgi:hypothetical protein